MSRGATASSSRQAPSSIDRQVPVPLQQVNDSMPSSQTHVSVYWLTWAGQGFIMNGDEMRLIRF
jgi:hypothetical protein